MGYSIYSTDNNVKLRRPELVNDVYLAALKWFREDAECDEDVSCLGDIASYFGCAVSYDPRECFVNISYESEKYDDGALGFINAIAPYVEEGSYIEFIGEQGDNWRWEVRDGQAYEVEPVKLWEQGIIQVSSLEDAKVKVKKVYMDGDVVLGELFAAIRIVGLTIEETLELVDYLRLEIDGVQSSCSSEQLNYDELQI